MNALMPGLIDVSKLVGTVHSYAKSGKIDDPMHLSNDMVYLYSGTRDTVVRPGMVWLGLFV